MNPEIENRPHDMEAVGEEKSQPGDTDALDPDVQTASAIPYRDDAFGDEHNAEIKYKVLKWWQCGLLMVATTISLGILALPAAVAGVGLAPAVIILIGLGVLCSYTGYVIGQFKLRYPHISSMADAGEVLMGGFGRELFFGAQLLFLIFIMASHIVTFIAAMNTITGHATCSIVFGVVGLVVSMLLSLPRTLKNMSWLSMASFASIFCAVLVTMIAVGVQNTPPKVGPTVDTNLITGFTSASNVVFAFASHNAFFNIMAELKDPKDFTKALALTQSLDISLYLIAAVVIYYYVGDDVPSPALGAAGPVVSKVAYGIALPTIIIAGVLTGHIACKSIYVRVFAGTNRMQKRDFVAVGSWVAIGLSLWIVSWIIAEAIPVFNNLLSLMTALFASWFCLGIPGVFWLYMNYNRWFSSFSKTALTLVNVICLCCGIILCGLGLYTSGKAIHDNPQSQSFSCGSTG
ncbi:transmembrane amino acid transporter protein-domain-containing protein [Aspergillus taichungensis]|uniref:Transmembrane amino acid transporter protein-domain-containing protein n=1 Tax=Aspergillus taichungensis TaxID=482145 RepID=A0A2J5I7N9_9EURO|nr:transmembrane amino acid transporter protein-domain-containing protein [Aspergillus taichungensis]